MATILKIISNSKYLILLILVALLVIAFSAWLPNLHLITMVMTSNMNIWQKINLLFSLLGSIQTNFTPLSRFFTFVIAGLTGVQVALLAYYVKKTAKIQKSMGMSAIGLTVSMLGVGCASCGSVILTSFIGIGTAASILNFLPFRGKEFSFIGISILLATIYFTVKKINDPFICKINNKGNK